jgi:hypothetical protein
MPGPSRKVKAAPGLARLLTLPRPSGEVGRGSLARTLNASSRQPYGDPNPASLRETLQNRGRISDWLTASSGQMGLPVAGGQKPTLSLSAPPSLTQNQRGS